MKTISTSLVILFSLFSCASLAMDEKEYWLFFSVFARGKSTIINALKKEYVAKTKFDGSTRYFSPIEIHSEQVLTSYFTSITACPHCGIAAYSIPGATLVNSGLLNYFTPYEDVENNRIYLDTPQLVDINMRKEAAKQTNLLLKQKGKYKIFFLIGTKDGRLCTDEITTLNAFMEAIEIPHKLFSIVINKEEEDVIEYLNEKNNKKEFFEGLNRPLTYKTNSVLFIAKNENWNIKKVDEKDRMLSLSNFQLEFFETSPAIEIKNKKPFLINKKELLKIIAEH